MSGIWIKLIVFLRWLVASEELPSPTYDSQRATPHTQSFISWLIEEENLHMDRSKNAGPYPSKRFLSWIFSAEYLPVSATERRVYSPGLWSWIISGEELLYIQVDENQIDSRTMFFRRLISPEVCPVDQSLTPKPHDGFLHQLLHPEACPSCNDQPPHTDRGFLQWVMAREDCPEIKAPAPPRGGGFLRWLLTRDKL